MSSELPLDFSLYDIDMHISLLALQTRLNAREGGARRLLKAGLVALALLTAGAGLAQAQDAALTRCREITDSLQRLACYDAAVPRAAKAERGAYAQMDLVDWKVDKAQLGDRKIEVAGVIMPFAGGALLSIKAGDTSPVFVETSGLAREQQRRLFSCTGMCRARVRGKTGEVLNQVGIVAEAVLFD